MTAALPFCGFWFRRRNDRWMMVLGEKKWRRLIRIISTLALAARDGREREKLPRGVKVTAPLASFLLGTANVLQYVKI